MLIPARPSCAFLFLALLRSAAQYAPPAATGTVTGHVLCGDTQRPARFAEVILLRKPENKAGESKQSPDKTADIVNARTLTGLDGSFTMRNVTPGVYYILGELEGYIEPFTNLSDEEDDQDDVARMEKFMARVPYVQVTAQQASQIDITIQRGAVITGKVEFSDGTPVIDAPVMIDQPEGGNQPLDIPGLQTMDMVRWPKHSSWKTDDDGHFRISGLQPGKYWAYTMVHRHCDISIEMTGVGQYGQHSYNCDNGPGAALIVFQPGKLFRTEAKVLEIKGDEHVTNADIVVPLDACIRSAAGCWQSLTVMHRISPLWF